MNRHDDYDPVEADFLYVANNVPGTGIEDENLFESQFSEGCLCQNYCSQACPCVRGSVNYVNDCIIQSESRLVMECNAHCSCNESCGNKLVQKGPLDCLIVKKTEKKGYGLFTNKPILKGRFICEYAGELISSEEAVKRFEIAKQRGEKNYTLVVNEFIGDKKITTCVDPSFFGNIGRYCNHSCAPKAEIVAVRVGELTPSLCLFATEDIKAFEEITFHYAGGSAQSVHRFSETPCACNSLKCQGYLPHQSV